MRNLKFQTESLQISMYCNIICQILFEHDKLSIIKISTFSYLIKQQRFHGGTIYNSRNEIDIVLKGISLLSGDFESYCNSLPFILKAIHILNSKNIIKFVDDDVLLADKISKDELVYIKNNFLYKVIEESK